MRGIAFSTVQALDRKTYAANSKTLRQILDILLKLWPANEAAPSHDKHQRASLSFALFGSITTLYRRGLKAVHLKNRVKQPRAETAISELQRRATASRNGGVFYARNVAEPPITFLWGLPTGSRKACRFLCNGYCRPESNPRPSTAIESGNKVLQRRPRPWQELSLSARSDTSPLLHAFIQPLQLRPRRLNLSCRRCAMNEKIYMDMMEAADCLETLGKLSQVFFSEVKPRPGLSDDRMGSTLAYLMKLLGERLNADLAELYEQPTSDNPTRTSTQREKR